MTRQRVTFPPVVSVLSRPAAARRAPGPHASSSRPTPGRHLTGGRRVVTTPMEEQQG